jgi:hypothetical protein
MRTGDSIAARQPYDIVRGQNDASDASGAGAVGNVFIDRVAVSAAVGA